MVRKNLTKYNLPVFDALSVLIALYASFLLRFEFQIPDSFLKVMLIWMPWFVLSHLVIFHFSGLYKRIWKYTSLFDMYDIFTSIIFTWVATISVLIIFSGTTGYPRSVLVLFPIFLTILVSGSRLAIRVYYSHYSSHSDLRSNKSKTLLLIGAGKTGDKISREILTTSRSQYSILGFVDDDNEKIGSRLQGKKIFCNVSDLPDLKIPYDEILITAPTATGDQMRRIVDACKLTGKRYKTIPGINELIEGEVNLATARDVSYSDLLGREEIILDMNSIQNFLTGKRVLITGAGGSIGSELVKQCLLFDPAEIICLDFNEEAIYNLDQNYAQHNPNTIIKTVLASVTSKKECEKVFIENRPQIVFHAAAYKHVPIQELHPWNAVNVNIGGTLNIVELSNKYNVKKFVLVSTDKAVNPVNVMGATKRAAEKLIQSYNLNSDSTFMAVRFGNVLGSSGSAIPTFQKQINKGGPITITHPEMTRYFMSIQEATQLILQCGSLGKDGQIFLLEMGKPLKIVQIAKDLIRLSGLEPDVDIPIVYTGLRPGEKLYEELQLLNETKVSTTHKKIMILKENNKPMPWSIFNATLKSLENAAKDTDSDKIIILLKQILPTYNPQIFSNKLERKDPLKFSSIKGEA